jgi:hypothetical protein
MAATMGYGAFLTGPPLIGFLADVLGFRLAMLVPLLWAVAIAARALDERRPRVACRRHAVRLVSAGFHRLRRALHEIIAQCDELQKLQRRHQPQD